MYMAIVLYTPCLALSVGKSAIPLMYRFSNPVIKILTVDTLLKNKFYFVNFSKAGGILSAVFRPNLSHRIVNSFLISFHL